LQKKIVLSSTAGQWMRIGIPFKALVDTSPKSVRLDITGKKDAYLYYDDVMVVKKQDKEPVLQLLKEGIPLDGSTSTTEMEILAPKAGEAFTVKYDIHKRDENDGMTDKSLIAAIYKTVGGKKQLVEINVGSFGETDTAVSLPMTGIAASENAAAYSMKVMLWDSITGMRNLKRANISFQ